ncbi:terminal beta-(1-_2)-arabinofuranosyltransferase [Kitasatospora albolonga]|uniref:hypothetical protein n=1 Tax=Kitasatospora albolonga TaxID=68173 RepID=UPI0031EB64CC
MTIISDSRSNTDQLSRPESPPEEPGGRWRTTRLTEAAAVVLPCALLAVGAYRHRWMADDGLIVTRTVRQLMAGNGPVFNVGERAETNTSTLWTYLLAALRYVLPVDLGLLAVWTGLVCTVLGLLGALLGARRLIGTAPAGSFALPAGALIVAVLPPFWDFATSALESGLVFGWLGLCWYALTRVPTGGRRAEALAYVVTGLGWLVRPDLLLISVVWMSWLIWRGRPSWPRLTLLLALAWAVPLAYQVFRMGYYGLLSPLPAVAKEAGSADVPRGLAYLQDFADTYYLWLPVLLTRLLAMVAPKGERVREGGGEGALRWMTLAGGVLMTIYVVRVGGDFMHARMLLPALFTLLLPTMLVHVRRAGLVLAGGLAAWAATCLVALRVDAMWNTWGVSNERAWTQKYTGSAHPDTTAVHIKDQAGFGETFRLAPTDAAPSLQLWFPDAAGGQYRVPVKLDYPTPVRYAVTQGGLGAVGAAIPLDALVIDPAGLAYPLGAHAAMGQRVRAGHEKLVPMEWLVADYAAADAALDKVPGLNPDATAAARAKLACGELQELQQSVRAPMTASRFWENLTGAFQRTVLRYDGQHPNAPAPGCTPLS